MSREIARVAETFADFVAADKDQPTARYGCVESAEEIYFKVRFTYAGMGLNVPREYKQEAIKRTWERLREQDGQ